MTMDTERITRIRAMERDYDRASRALASLKDSLGRLRDYMDSGQWLRDYEADERGELPVGLKRGVLSQDALYDLLTSVKEVLGRMDNLKP